MLCSKLETLGSRSVLLLVVLVSFVDVMLGVKIVEFDLEFALLATER